MKTNESGRSMVEMMAVLAIAGIIIVGAMTGFRVAMQKLKSNDVAGFVSDVSRYAQMRSRDITNAVLGGFDEPIPDCVNRFRAFSNGKVTLEFKEEDNCQQIHSLVATSFKAGQWVKEDEIIGCYVGVGQTCRTWNRAGCNSRSCKQKKCIEWNETTGECTRRDPNVCLEYNERASDCECISWDLPTTCPNI